MLARKRVAQKHGFQAKTMIGLGGYGNVQPNYDNHKVQEIKERLGPFKYDPAPANDGVKRVKKAQITLENGARYEGEWNESTGKRDGKGV